MPSLTYHFYFLTEKQHLKVKDRKTKKKRRPMYFQIAVNLICMFSCVNHVFFPIDL